MLVLGLLGKRGGVLVLVRIWRRWHGCGLLLVALEMTARVHRLARHLLLELDRSGGLAVLEGRLEMRGHGG